MTELILYHCLCLLGLLFTYIDSKGKRKELKGSLEMVYIMTGLVIMSDCLWSILSFFDVSNTTLLYGVNMVYFAATTLGVYAWMRFSLKTLKSRLYHSKTAMALLLLPALLTLALACSTPFTGLIFSIQDGEYVRGTLFFLDSLIKLLYLLFASALAFFYAHKETRIYKKRNMELLAAYCIPVLIGGLLQAVFGIDLNCSAPVIGLAIVYKFGLSNSAKDNEDLAKAIGGSYAAAFIVDTDERTVRTLVADDDYAALAIMAKSMPYEDCLHSSIREHVAPEDKILVEEGFAITAILRHLEDKNSHSLIYRVNSQDGQERFRKATFMKAFDDADRHEIFLGIEDVETRQILLQQKEELEEEKEQFERVKENFTTVIANIIEARDVDSGEHVMRVKKYTQLLCNQVMEDYPEFGLTPLTVRYITNGSALHDIGKIMIPDAILLKTGKLSDEEYALMKTHCEKGCRILDKLPDDLDADYVRYAKEICRWHHERYDGKGYPDGLVGDQIPISAQIVSLADCFDALTAKRVYKDAMTKEEAFEALREGRCGTFNTKLLNSFSKIY